MDNIVDMNAAIQKAQTPHCVFCNGTGGMMEHISLYDTALGGETSIYICNKCVPGVIGAGQRAASRAKNTAHNEGTTVQNEQKNEKTERRTETMEKKVMNKEENQEVKTEEGILDNAVVEDDGKVKKILKKVGYAAGVIAAGVVGLLIGRGMNGDDDGPTDAAETTTEG